MTSTHHDTLPETLTPQEMDAYVADGMAERWTTVLPGGRLPVAAIVHPVWRQDPAGKWLLESGTWYVVLEGDEGLFRPASAQQSEVFIDATQRMRMANDAVAHADADSSRPAANEEP